MILNIGNFIKKYLIDNNIDLFIYINQFPFEIKDEFISIFIENENINFITNSIEVHFQIFIVSFNYNNAIIYIRKILNIIKNNYDITLLNEDGTKEYIVSGIILKYISHLGVNEKGKYETSINLKLVINNKEV